jgi:hypothetical protein
VPEGLTPENLTKFWTKSSRLIDRAEGMAESYHKAGYKSLAYDATTEVCKRIGRRYSGGH